MKDKIFLVWKHLKQGTLKKIWKQTLWIYQYGKRYWKAMILYTLLGITGTGVSLIALYFFSAVSSPIPFYTFAALSQFFFCGFNTAIYAIVPDCVEYGEWKTGVRNDGFQYAFVSLGNKLGMAIGTSALAGVLSTLSFAPNQVQNAAVQNAMHYAFSLLPGVLWLITAIVLFFYRISKRSYNQIMSELNAKKTG